ncbi:hypothetical protein OP500_01360 [Kingella sp. SNUBH-2017]|uniref:hypothetical protein n=1 Tax=Kingella sp. SNUBH-2017 TaxID=2994077 RepID=UPI0023639C0E|nr:hypothetical protein [Kingella sp. SNUBH-2017]MDD2181974.1 hypothetical protein [Kingella sp. SNUBH-2017]
MPAGKSGLQWGNFKAKAPGGETAGRGKRRVCGMSMAAVGHFNRRQGGFLPNCGRLFGCVAGFSGCFADGSNRAKQPERVGTGRQPEKFAFAGSEFGANGSGGCGKRRYPCFQAAFLLPVAGGGVRINAR